MNVVSAGARKITSIMNTLEDYEIQLEVKSKKDVALTSKVEHLKTSIENLKAFRKSLKESQLLWEAVTKDDKVEESVVKSVMEMAKTLAVWDTNLQELKQEVRKFV